MTTGVSYLTLKIQNKISFVNTSSDGKLIVAIGTTGISDPVRYAFYSSDYGKTWETHELIFYLSYDILGTSSFEKKNGEVSYFYVFYWTTENQTSDKVALPYLNYEIGVDYVIFKEYSIPGAVSGDIIYCLSVNNDGSSLSVASHKNGTDNYFIRILNEINVGESILSGYTSDYTDYFYVQPIHISTSFIKNGNYYYCLVIDKNYGLYSCGYDSSSNPKLNYYNIKSECLCLSNFIKNNSTNYAAFILYSSNAINYSLRIYDIIKSTGNYITLNISAGYFSDDYATFTSVNQIFLSSAITNNTRFVAAVDSLGLSYFNGSNVYRYDSAITNGGSFTNCSGSYSETLSQQIIYASNGSNYIYKISEIVCFLQGTKLTIFENNEEIEKNIENLKIGDLVKIEQDIYKKINFIGYQNIDIVDNIKYLNVLKKDSISENLPYEDLYLTTGHSLLFKDLKYANKYYNKNSYNNNIKNFYKIMAQHCSLCNYITKSEIKNYINNDEYVKVYNFSLESEDPSSQYAVYSNGIRSECMSYEYAINKSNMSPL